MYILKVIPIAKGLPNSDFSYFSKENLSLGSIVEIKIRNRKLLGLVANIDEVEDKKMDIKSEKFILKKIERIVKKDFINENIFKSILESATLLGIKESEILENYLPDFIFEANFISSFKIKEVNKENILRKEITSTLADIETRFKKYKEIIKKTLEKDSSLLIFFPTINDLEFARIYFEENLAKENEEKIVYFHSQQTKKELKNNLQIIENNKNILILSTPSLFPFLIKENTNLDTVIIEKENSVNYFTHTSKKQIDAREILKKISRDLSLNILLGGNMLSIQTFIELKDSLETQNENKNLFEIIDLKKEKELKKEEIETKTKNISNKKLSTYSSIYFSEKLVEKLEDIKEKKGRAFLYAKRKGLYTETVCSDCESVLKCEKCAKPYTLFKEDQKTGNRNYICLSCKEKIELKKSEDLACRNCGSWRMNTLGVGVEAIEENLKKSGWKTFIIDSQNIKTKKDIINTFQAWQKEESSVLIGTDLALNFINKNYSCDLGAIISLDSLFSIPEINIDEKIFSICLDMREKVANSEKIIIETRLSDNPIWEYIKNGSVEKFLNDELENRKAFTLPPYSNILKFRLDKKDLGFKNNIEKILEKIFKEENIRPEKVSWRLDKKSGSHIATLNIKKEYWEIKKEARTHPTSLTKKITTLLSDFYLEINPPNVYN